MKETHTRTDGGIIVNQIEEETKYPIFPLFRHLFIFALLRLVNIRAVKIDFSDEDVQGEVEITNILKRRQFVETLEGWRNGFVRVIVTNDSVFIGHAIKGNKLTVVSNPVRCLNDFINYFQRL